MSGYEPRKLPRQPDRLSQRDLNNPYNAGAPGAKTYRDDLRKIAGDGWDGVDVKKELAEIRGVEAELSVLSAFEKWLDERIERADETYRKLPLSDTAVPPLVLKMVRGKLQELKRQSP